VSQEADLSITKVADVRRTAPGGSVTYTIAITNDGPSDATAVQLVDELPDGVAFDAATAGGLGSGGFVTWTFGTLAQGATVEVHVTVTVEPGSPTLLENVVVATSGAPDPDAGDRIATADVRVVSPDEVADLEVIKRAVSDGLRPGGRAVYRIVVVNHGPAEATHVVIVDELPRQLSYASARVSAGTFHAPKTWRIDHLDVGQRETLVLTTRVAEDAAGSAIGNVVRVARSDQVDVEDANDVSTRVLDLVGAMPDEQETSAGPLARTGGGTASAARAAVLLATVGVGSFILAGSRRRRSTRSPAA
jgi:uncharacterized repeat protein (TIGR01451 family)